MEEAKVKNIKKKKLPNEKGIQQIKKLPKENAEYRN